MKLLLTIGAVLILASVAYAAMDYQCFNKCLQAGYSYGYCKSVCSY